MGERVKSDCHKRNGTDTVIVEFTAKFPFSFSCFLFRSNLAGKLNFTMEVTRMVENILAIRVARLTL